MQSLLFHCRAGQETTLCAELQHRLPEKGLYGYAQPGPGLVIWQAGQNLLPWQHKNLQSDLVFSRSLLLVLQELPNLNSKDRVADVLAALSDLSLSGQFGGLRIEETDDPQTRDLATLGKKLTHPMRAALRKQGYLTTTEKQDMPWLVLVLIGSSSAYLCQSILAETSPYPMGVLRLKMPSRAPSRSTLKLDEACRLMLDDDQDWFIADRWSVDLGAAPGGWTWQLVKRQQRVYAIDNGPMDDELMASGLVEHLKADGFRWQPPQKVDWLVCDMITQPQRTTELMLSWLQQGWATRAIFNLKLPMKKRWPMVASCLEQLEQGLASHYRIKARQLYHDRDEVTVVIYPE